MDEAKVIDHESRRPLSSSVRISHPAHIPTYVEDDESDDSRLILAELNGHEQDIQDDQEKSESSVAELRGGESFPPPAEAKGDHSDGEHEEKTEIPRLPPNTSSAEPPSSRSTNQDIHTEGNRVSSLDISTMQTAIQTGNSKAVDELMTRLSEKLAVDELTTTYGGACSGTNAGLFGDTSPILHAAQSGNLAVFKSVMGAMQEKLSQEKVKEMLAKKNVQRQLLLAVAARSGSKGVLEGVLLAIQQKFEEHEVKYMLAARDKQCCSVLDMAARSGSKGVLEHVLSVVRRELSENEDVFARDYHGAVFLLASAIRSGSMDVVEHVLLVIRQEFSENKVSEILQSTDRSGNSLPAWAASSGNSDVFKIMFELANDKKRDMLTSKNNEGASLLALAVSSGNRNVFDTVLETVTGYLTEDKMKGMLTSMDKTGTSVLARAVKSRNRDIFKAVLRVVTSNLEAQEVKTVITSRDTQDKSLLALAIGSESVEMFRVAMETVSKKLADGEKKDMLTSKDGRGASLLALAVSSGNMNIFKTVLETVTGYLTTKDEVKDMLTSMDKKGASVLARAIKSRSRDTFEAVLRVVTSYLAPNEVKSMLMSKHWCEGSLLIRAVESKSRDTFGAFMRVIIRDLEGYEVIPIIKSRDNQGRSLLALAIISKRVDMFSVAMQTVSERLPDHEEIKKELRANSKDGQSLLMYAASSGRKVLFKAVRDTLWTYLPKPEREKMISSRNKKGDSLLLLAVRSQSVEMFKAVMVVAVDNLHEEEVVEMLCEKKREETLLGAAINRRDLGVCDILLRRVQDYLRHTRMQSGLDTAFMFWQTLYQKDPPGNNDTSMNRLFKILSMLLRHSARPPPEFLRWAASDDTEGKEHLWPFVTESLLIGVESARNPLVPGMNLSVPLAQAAEGAREGERRRILWLQTRVDEYVLEVLERLPQTIQGFAGGITQCSALFEPEGPRNGLCGRHGPLRVAFERRHQMESLCAVPLVMDYLSRRFTSGLPDMQDSDCVLQDTNALSRPAEAVVGGELVLGYTQDDSNGRPVFDHDPFGESCISLLRDYLQGPVADGPGPTMPWLSFLHRVLQRAVAYAPSLTISPGAQFIIAGLLAKPNMYYRVPAMRMAMDFVVYMMMLCVYSFWVLLHEDGPLTHGEIYFAIYIVAGVFTEVAEIRRDPKVYLQDPWNFFDGLALVMLIGGFIVRLAAGGSIWGRALYALSAPLVFSRILFFLQILQFQGPMIQVMFHMGAVLLQFGVVLFVVMMGFAMSLYPLLRDNSLTFEAIQLLLFKTLLGDVDAFDEFDESTQNRYSTFGRLILAMYLVVMTIMMLNLLIAVLSTKHTKVDVNADKEFKVSRARIIEHYRLAVAFNILPAPFNLPQLVLTLPFLRESEPVEQNKTYTRTMEAVGQVSFWLVLSPLVLAGGVLLWVTSGMYYICQPLIKWLFSSPTSLEPTTQPLRVVSIVLWFWCTLGAPLCLLALWLRQPFRFIYNGVIPSRMSGGSVRPSQDVSGGSTSSVDVQEMLRDAGIEASDLRKYLEDPMCDPVVRSDEVDRGTTVKHMKLLRDRLENKFNERVDHLEKKLNGRVDSLEANIRLVLEILRRE